VFDSKKLRDSFYYPYCQLMGSSYDGRMAVVFGLLHKMGIKLFPLLKFFVLGLVIFLIAGCQWRVMKNPSVLIIAVEGLAVDDVLCPATDENLEGPASSSGFDDFCRESIRFTHAYTTSIMTQSALTSILTGLFPDETSVWHNGANHLREDIETLSELALTKNYNTSFFSGGPPIFGKSGLTQGFLHFDDTIDLEANRMYRPAQKIVSAFFNWLDNESGSRPYFTAMYWADLQFLTETIVGDDGRVQPKGLDPQKAQVSVALSRVIAGLKSRKRWDYSTVVLVGLNGKNKTHRETETKSTNLLSENVQVALLIKPSRENRESATHWTIDANVSIADIAPTIREMLSLGDDNKNGVSLAKALKKPVVDWERDRLIETSSGWTAWRGFGAPRMSVRKEHYLYVFDQKPKFYNSLSDRNEMLPIALADSNSDLGVPGEFRRHFLQKETLPWMGLSQTTLQELLIFERSTDSALAPTQFESDLVYYLESGKGEIKRLFAGWVANFAIENAQWDLLEKIANEKKMNSWLWLAQVKNGKTNSEQAIARLLKEKKVSIEFLRSPCWAGFYQLITKPNQTTGFENCETPEFQLMLQWLATSRRESKEKIRAEFNKYWNWKRLDDRVLYESLRLGHQWDVDVDEFAFPNDVQVLLQFPEFSQLADR
jgi:hypothetical protein